MKINRPTTIVSPLFYALGLLGLQPLYAQQPDQMADMSAFHSASLPFDNHFLEANRALVIGNYSEALASLRQCLSLRPDEPSVHHLLAKAYKELEKADEAIYHAGEAVRLDPKNHWYHISQAEIYEKYNYFLKAAEALMQASALVPQGSESLKLQAVDLYIQAMEYKTALKILDQLEKKVGADDDIIRRRYNVLIKMGKRKQAEKLLEHLKNENPDSDILRGALLNHYKYFKNTKKSLQLLREWLARDPDNGEVWIELGNLYFENRDYDRAYDAFAHAVITQSLDARKQIEVLLFMASRFDRMSYDEMLRHAESIAARHPFAPEPFALLGDLLAKQGNKPKAIQAYQKTISNGGEKESVYQQLLLLLTEENRYKEAVKVAKDLTTLYPDNSAGYALGAISAFQIGDYRSAVQMAQDGLPKSTGNKPVRFQLSYILAESHHKLDNHDQSDEYFEKALNIDPNNVSALNNYAYYLAERGEKLNKALVLITKANELHAQNPTYLDTWAWVHYKRGEYQEALEKIEKALKFGGDQSSVIMEHYGDILQKLGFYSKAMAAYHAALDSSESKEQLLLKIRNLRTP
ncbi:MAG: tetratricopeptide repeat protein [Thermaurantimonas sp.]